MKDKVMQVGNLLDNPNFDNPQRGRVYSVKGISPALDICGGGGQEKKIVVIDET